MKRPTITQARALCKALEARAVIVIALGCHSVAAASYAGTRHECRQAGYTLDLIVDAINEGRIPVWEEKS